MRRTTAAIVDELGEVKERLRELKERQERLIAQLKRKGLGDFVGEEYTACVYEQNRETVDWEGLAEKLGYTFRQRKKYTQVVPILCCSVSRKPEDERGTAKRTHRRRPSISAGEAGGRQRLH